MGVESRFSFDWNDERVALAINMWTEGKPASWIATVLGGGLTRSAVIGKINRMGLSRCALGSPAPLVDVEAAPAALNPKSPPAATSRPPRTPPHSDRRSPSPTAERPYSLAGSRVEKEPAPIPVMLSQVKIADLLGCHCRWIPGAVYGADTLYCGEAVRPGGPYCEFHAEMNSGRGTVAERSCLRALSKQSSFAGASF